VSLPVVALGGTLPPYRNPSKKCHDVSGKKSSAQNRVVDNKGHQYVVGSGRSDRGVGSSHTARRGAEAHLIGRVEFCVEETFPQVPIIHDLQSGISLGTLFEKLFTDCSGPQLVCFPRL